MFYIALVAYLATTYAIPLPVPTQLLYYPHPQYIKAAQYLPFPVAKSIQSGHNQNDLFYYPPFQLATPQQLLVKNQPVEATPSATSKFTPPPEGLVNAIFAWFAENNIALPDGPSRNDILNQIKKEKPESTEKPAEAGEADVLAEADKNSNADFPKKVANPTLKPGHRFYILNGQPQFIGLQTMYPQPVLPRQVVPQVVMRSAIPEDPNLIFYQPQTELQQSNLKLRNSGIGVQNQEVGPQNVLLVKNLPESSQEEIQNIRPLRYHGNPFAQKVNEQQSLTNFPQQLYLSTDQSGARAAPIQTLYQTHYVPIGVVPPEENQIRHFQPQFSIPTSEYQGIPNQHLSFIHIPINKDVQIPQYIKTVVPVDANGKVTADETNSVKTSFVSNPQETKDTLESRFAASDVPKETVSNEETVDPSAELAALEFVRYIASRQNDQLGDTVVIDAKTDFNDGTTDSDTEEIVQASEPAGPSMAQAQPAAIALAGPGGVAGSAPKATALAGEKGLAISSPRATSVAGPNPDKSKPNKKS